MIHNFIYSQQTVNTQTDKFEQTSHRAETYTLNDEIPASFPKGLNSLKHMIEKKFKVRKELNTSQNLTCEITFIIERDGSMSDIKAFGNNESFNNEIVNSMGKIKDKWIPAQVDGQKIRSRYKLPLTMSFK